jgi:hypothetical protein
LILFCSFLSVGTLLGIGSECKGIQGSGIGHQEALVAAKGDEDAGRVVFEGIVGRMTAAHAGVGAGRMMSCAAVSYKGKVFAFLGG